MIAMLLAATVLLADVTAAAMPPAVSTSTTPPSKKLRVEPDTLICKRERVIGTRMPSKVCRTAKQWQDRKAADRQDLERSQRSELTG